jgi:lipopolysaccharide transport system ATP-binding protein
MPMSKVVIAVENLSKRYMVGHRSAQRESYATLRDIIGREIRNFARKTVDVVRGRQIVEGDEIEEFWALQDVTFEVTRGEVLGIIGRNGAGKSTLLKILSRITEPDRGRVTLRGRVSSLLEVGTGFHPELTGRENIFLNGAILGMRRAEIKRKFDEIVAFSEMERFLDTPVKQYSSGMYVRLAFAVAAHLEPDILIVDEALAVGDAAFQEKCVGKLNSVAHSDGRTVLFVSHNMSAIRQLCRRAVLLHDGRLTSDGDPGEVVQKYLSRAGMAEDAFLRARKDRETTGEAMITDFELCDEQGMNIDSVLLGNKLRFLMTVEFRRPVVRAFFGILVHSASGDPILNLRSANEGLRVDRNEGRVTVEAVVDHIWLYPGEYTLSPYVHDEIRNIDFDYVPHYCRLWVHPAPGVHGHRKLDPKWGKYFVSSSWAVLDPGNKRLDIAAE